ncbi:Phosphoethanolamine transferase EptA [compost metagenome]
MLAWFSPQWQQDSGLSGSCLQATSKQRYSHDNLFHSVLGLMAVRTTLYQPVLDIFAACRAPQTAAAPAALGA